MLRARATGTRHLAWQVHVADASRAGRPGGSRLHARRTSDEVPTLLAEEQPGSLG